MCDDVTREKVSERSLEDYRFYFDKLLGPQQLNARYIVVARQSSGISFQWIRIRKKKIRRHIPDWADEKLKREPGGNSSTCALWSFPQCCSSMIGFPPMP